MSLAAGLLSVGFAQTAIAAVGPEIRVTGSSVTINNNDITPSSTDGTDFGSVALGSSAQTRVFYIYNEGTQPLSISSLTVTGAAFALTISSSSTVPAGGASSFEVSYQPTAAGLQTGSVTIGNNDSDENPTTFSIQGFGLAPQVSVAGKGITIANNDTTPSTDDNTDFGSLTVGSDMSRSFSIHNNGDAPLNVSNVQVTGTGFSLDGGFAGAIQPGGTQSFGVRYAPLAAGTTTGTVTVSTNDPNVANYTFQVKGLATQPEIDIQGNSLSVASGDSTPSAGDGTLFSTISNGFPGGVSHFTVRNTGNGNLLLKGITLSDSTNFSADFTGSPAPIVAPGGTAELNVRYVPKSAGTHTSTVTIQNNDLDEGNYVFTVQGTTLGSSMDFGGITNGDNTPDPSDKTGFGNVIVGGPSKTNNFVVSNAGPGVLLITSVDVSPNTHFTFPGTVPMTVPAGSTLQVPIVFSPQAMGLHTAVVTVHTNDTAHEPFTFTVNGTGLQRSLAIGAAGNVVANGDATPSALDGTDYGSIAVDGSQLDHTWPLRNTGNVPLTISSVTSSLPGDFSIVAPYPGAIDGGSSTNLIVRFNPSAIGVRTAVITVVSDDPSSPYTFTVTGRGAPRIGQPIDDPIGPVITECPWDPSIAGDFTGTIIEDDGHGNPGDTIRGGFDSFKLNSDGTFTAKGNVDGLDITLKGKLNPDGSYDGTTKLSDGSTAVVKFRLYQGSDGSNRIIGTLVHNNETLHIDVIRSGAVALPASLTGPYTMVIPGNDAAPPTEPHGDGVGFLTVRIDGSVRCQYIMGDGSTTTRSSKISPRYVWQYQFPIYNGGWKKGYVAGRMVFRDVPGVSDFDGKVFWKKYASSNSQDYYPGGFAVERNCVGAKYTPPAKGSSAMPGLASGADNAEFKIGAAAEGVPAQSLFFTWNKDDTIKSGNSPKVALRVVRSTGSVSGTYTDAISRSKVRVYGAILQKQQLVGGLFKGYQITGFVTIAPKSN
ncbi:choice-of-anchor D domain-containing protein [Luteolibacter sp. LG18]|uniref:choice-of-anchor D domain-containing protein n=1 Tax=Luteolibacter sp. LG18 TaxID=2819286 RepID=UPI0030C72FA1